MSTRRQIKKMLLRDIAALISKDDDLMPPEFDEEGCDRNGRAWQHVRDELVAEFERRSRT